MKYKLYEKTAARLARAGAKDPTAQIIYLAEEIERYRAKIHGLEALLNTKSNDEEQDAQLTAALNYVAQEYKKAKGLEYVRNPLAWALHQVWKIADGLEDQP